MTITQLFFFIIISLILLAAHSYFVRGGRITLTFFLFAFIAGMRKETGTFLGPSLSNMEHPTPFVHSLRQPLSLSVMNTVLGWMLVFYLAWCVAEKIVQRSRHTKDGLFPTLFFAGLTVMALSYGIEATAVNVGWWRWVFFDPFLSDFLAGGVHFFALNAWFCFAVHFLAPYFLIECSAFRHKAWKCIFFLIPFLRTTVMLFLGSHKPRELYDGAVFYSLLALLFFCPFRFEFPHFFAHRPVSRRALAFLDNTPFIVLSVIICVLLLVDIITLQNRSLLISLLPLVFLGLLAMKRIPVWLSTACSLLAPAAFGKIGIAACVPGLVFCCFLSSRYLLAVKKGR